MEAGTLRRWPGPHAQADEEDIVESDVHLDHDDAPHKFNYLVGCHYSLPDDRLWAIGRTSELTLGYFPVKNDPAGGRRLSWKEATHELWGPYA